MVRLGIRPGRRRVPRKHPGPPSSSVPSQGVARERRRGEDAAGRAAETALGSNAGGETVPWQSMAPEKDGHRWK